MSVFFTFYCTAFTYKIITGNGAIIFPLTIEHLLFVFFFAFVITALFQYFYLYRINVLLDPVEHSVKLLLVFFIATILYAFFAFFLRAAIVTDSRLTVALFFPVAVTVVILYRVIFFIPVFKILTKKNIYRENALIVGSGEVARLLAASLEFNPSYGLTVLGFADDTLAYDTTLFHAKKVLGKITDIESLVRQHRINEIILCVEGTSVNRLLEILDICSRTSARLKIASPLYGIISKKIVTETYGDIPVVDVSTKEENHTYYGVKRVLDIVLAILGLLLLSPLLMLIALAILIDSGRPVIFSQIRIGRNGKPFKFYKFRSMYVDKNDEPSRHIKIRDFIKRKTPIAGGSTKIVDPSKITRVGHFIRKTSLDELPQLVNVLKGDMSLVGPRPCLPYEWEEYDDWHKRRLSTIPGCTGVWQVSGRSEVSFDDMVILDLYYIQNQSLLLDLKIILKTIPVMILGKGGL